jgi:hypothetical protein
MNVRRLVPCAGLMPGQLVNLTWNAQIVDVRKLELKPA